MVLSLLLFQNCDEIFGNSFHSQQNQLEIEEDRSEVTSACANSPEIQQQNFTIESDGLYHHFGMVTQDKNGKLHSVYRTGDDHYNGGRIFYRNSSDSGFSWSEPVELSSPTNDALLDYRDPNIGQTNSGILVVPYVLKTVLDPLQNHIRSTSWKYKFSTDGGVTWSEEQLFDENLRNGLPYGRPFAIPGTQNQIVFSGYYATNGNYVLANWKGVFKKEGTRVSVTWEQLPPIISTNNSRYEYVEHSIIPLSSNQWIAASRGEDSLNLFHTRDGGQTWIQEAPMLDIAEGRSTPFHQLVAPMLDVISIDGTQYLLMLYTERFDNPDSATAFFRVGKIRDQELVWSQPVEIDEYTNKLSGYQSGVFLKCQNLKYYHLSYNEKNIDRTQADVEAHIIDFSKFDFDSF